MKRNWNFLEGEGVQNKIPFMGGVWTISETTLYRGKHQCETSAEKVKTVTVNCSNFAQDDFGCCKVCYTVQCATYSPPI